MAQNEILFFAFVQVYWTRNCELNSASSRAFVCVCESVYATQWDSCVRCETIANKTASWQSTLLVSNGKLMCSLELPTHNLEWWMVLCLLVVVLSAIGVPYVAHQKATKKLFCFITLLPNAYRLMEFKCFRPNKKRTHTHTLPHRIPINFLDGDGDGDVLRVDGSFIPRGLNWAC